MLSQIVDEPQDELEGGRSSLQIQVNEDVLEDLAVHSLVGETLIHFDEGGVNVILVQVFALKTADLTLDERADLIVALLLGNVEGIHLKDVLMLHVNSHLN